LFCENFVMSLSIEEVMRIASLARLETSPTEALATQSQLNNIFDLIGQMRAADTTGIEPMSHGQDLILRLREDVVTEENQREPFQSVAPQVEAGLYLVPKVIE
jgi:aspartyl-tRNA(Asn)/glutamyl-tRNA(Gln) amidotransferase subunit C